MRLTDGSNPTSNELTVVSSIVSCVSVETFIKRHIVERTKKTEIRPVEQSEKTDSCQENLWNEIQSKEP